jgi:cytochrome c-type biogenesis protein
MTDISFFLAFTAGLLSFLSPCVLPLVPAYISYLTGTSVAEINNKKARLNAFYKSVGFVIGFSLTFILMGASITSLGKLFITNQSIFRKVAGIFIIIFGLHTLGIFKIRFFYREKRFLSFNKTAGTFSSVFMGMAFAAGWTPCIGPILSSILIYASSAETASKGIILLSVYSLGLAVPFISTALAIDSLAGRLKKIYKYMPIISALSGVLMILMGLMIFFNRVVILSQYFNFFNF